MRPRVKILHDPDWRVDIVLADSRPTSGASQRYHIEIIQATAQQMRHSEV